MRKKLTRYICAALAAAMLTPLSSAYAKEWVHVSSWAYNDVSNFTNEELLPESFDSISDYREPITVEQFCELVYNIGIKSGMTKPEMFHKRFIDSDNEAVNALLSTNNTVVDKIILDMPQKPSLDATREELDAISQDIQEKFDYYESLYPQTTIQQDDSFFVMQSNAASNLRREDAADILTFKSRWGFSIDSDDEVPEGVSYPDASPEAYRGIYFAKLFGLMDATADPKEDMTIEQAITAVYRLWKAIPTVSREDGGAVGSTEALVQTYSNGVEEYKIPLYYVLKKDGAVLKQFESDIYKNIYCADTADGRSIAAAQTYNGNTELYDLADGSMTAKLNYLTEGMDSEYITTKSSDMGPMCFGLCAYDGSTILEPCYSMEEISILRNNGFKGIEMPYRKPDGWIYYSDWNDGGKLYRIDSNGENKQLLCEDDCFNTKYIDGYLYYSVRGENENKLFCMKADGTEKEQISTGYAYVFTENDIFPLEDDFGSIDGWVYYIENEEQLPYYSNGGMGYLWRVKHTPEGTVKEQVTYFKGKPRGRTEDCMYFANFEAEHREMYLITKDGPQKLDFSDMGIHNADVAQLCEDTIVIRLFDNDSNDEILVCAPFGSSDFTLCTHEHDSSDMFMENGRYHYPQEEESDSRYQVGFSYDPDQRWVKNMTTGELKYIEAPGYIFARRDDILYLEDSDNRKLYSYDIATANTTPLTDNVLYAEVFTGDYAMYTDINKNYVRVNIHDGAVVQTYPNSGALRYGEFYSLKKDKDNHLLKLDRDGRYVDLTGSHAEYYGYVPY